MRHKENFYFQFYAKNLCFSTHQLVWRTKPVIYHIFNTTDVIQKDFYISHGTSEPYNKFFDDDPHFNDKIVTSNMIDKNFSILHNKTVFIISLVLNLILIRRIMNQDPQTFNLLRKGLKYSIFYLQEMFMILRRLSLLNGNFVYTSTTLKPPIDLLEHEKILEPHRVKTLTFSCILFDSGQTCTFTTFELKEVVGRPMKFMVFSKVV